MAVVSSRRSVSKEGQTLQWRAFRHRMPQEEVISVATIRGVFGITSKSRRDGNEARELALLLRAGSLPRRSTSSNAHVGPSPRPANIERGVRALVIGMLATGSGW
jgi:preprotein translocase subunit SecD